MGNIYSVAFLIGRILIGGFFLVAGCNHFAHLGMIAGYARMKGTPAPLAVGASGILLLLVGASLLLGFQPCSRSDSAGDFSAAYFIHDPRFWSIQDSQAKIGEMTQFQQNIATLGLLLMTLLNPATCPMSFGR